MCKNIFYYKTINRQEVLKKGAKICLQEEKEMIYC